MESTNRKAFSSALGLAGETASDLLNALDLYSDVAEPTPEQVTQVVAWNNTLKSIRDLVRMELSKTARTGALL